MKLKTSKSIMGFFGISVACAMLGAVVQVNKNLNSSRMEEQRTNELKVVAQEALSNRCRRSEGGLFEIGQQIPVAPGTLIPTSCYENGLKEYAYVAIWGGKPTVMKVFTQRQVDAKISEIKGDKNE